MATNARFFLRVNLHRGDRITTVDAPFLPTLPTLTVSDQGYLVVCSVDNGTRVGLFMWSGYTWQQVLPQVTVSQVIKDALVVDVYFCCSGTRTLEGDFIYRNGVLTTHTTVSVPANDTSRWATLNTQYGTGGTGDVVKSVNSVLPDSSGNVELTQFAEYSLSVTQTPEPEASLLYLVFDASMTYKRATVALKTRPAIDNTIHVLLDGVPAGTITLGATSVEDNISLTEVLPGQTLELSLGPESTNGLTQFSLNLVFQRS